MFYGRMTYLLLEKPVTDKDRTGFVITSYTVAGNIRIYIVEKSASAYRTNELNLTESQWVGFTQEKLEVGDRVDGRYIVDYVSKSRNGYAVSLSSWRANE